MKRLRYTRTGGTATAKGVASFDSRRAFVETLREWGSIDGYRYVETEADAAINTKAPDREPVAGELVHYYNGEVGYAYSLHAEPLSRNRAYLATVRCQFREDYQRGGVPCPAHQ